MHDTTRGETRPARHAGLEDRDRSRWFDAPWQAAKRGRSGAVVRNPDGGSFFSCAPLFAGTAHGWHHPRVDPLRITRSLPFLVCFPVRRFPARPGCPARPPYCHRHRPCCREQEVYTTRWPPVAGPPAPVDRRVDIYGRSARILPSPSRRPYRHVACLHLHVPYLHTIIPAWPAHSYEMSTY